MRSVCLIVLVMFFNFDLILMIDLFLEHMSSTYFTGMSVIGLFSSSYYFIAMSYDVFALPFLANTNPLSQSLQGSSGGWEGVAPPFLLQDTRL